jgi:hypothetical protein
MPDVKAQGISDLKEATAGQIQLARILSRMSEKLWSWQVRNARLGTCRT